MLTFRKFQDINLQRCLRWNTGKNGINSWSLSDWSVAMAGEVGEFFNVVKKLNRERDGIVGNTLTEKELKHELAMELADIIHYCFILGESEGIDVETACINKFNAVSERNNFPERL